MMLIKLSRDHKGDYCRFKMEVSEDTVSNSNESPLNTDKQEQLPAPSVRLHRLIKIKINKSVNCKACKKPIRGMGAISVLVCSGMIFFCSFNLFNQPF